MIDVHVNSKNCANSNLSRLKTLAIRRKFAGIEMQV